MISALVSIIIFCIVAGLLWYLVTLLPLPEPFPTIIRIAFVLILILLLLGMFTGYVPVSHFGLR